MAFALQAGPDQRPRQDAVRLPHHQARRTRKPGTTRTLDEVRQQLTDQLVVRARADAGGRPRAERSPRQITKPADLDTVAKAQGLTVQETGLLRARRADPGARRRRRKSAARAFEMKPGRGVRRRCRTRAASCSRRSSAKQDPYVPKLDEVKDRVRDEVVKQKARELGQQKAAELAAKLKGAPDFEKAAKAAGVEAKTTELITRDSPIPDLGVAPAVDEAAFTLPVGAVSDPIATDHGHGDRQGAREAGSRRRPSWRRTRTASAKSCSADRRNRFFSAYMVKAKQKMKIEVNREALQRVVG